MNLVWNYVKNEYWNTLCLETLHDESTASTLQTLKLNHWNMTDTNIYIFRHYFLQLCANILYNWKVQGSNPGLTTNLWQCFGLCSVVHPQFRSKFPALALQTDLVQLCQYLLFARHVKISLYIIKKPQQQIRFNNKLQHFLEGRERETISLDGVSLNPNGCKRSSKGTPPSSSAVKLLPI